MEKEEINKLTNYIEENLRASRLSGISFVDTRNVLNRLQTEQNHVAFGRRGAGKTGLLKASSDDAKSINIYLNLEDFKNITFPNIIIRVLVGMLENLSNQIKPWYKFSPKSYLIKRRIKRTCDGLNPYLYQPDQEVQEISTNEESATGFSAAANVRGLSGSADSKSTISRKVKRTLPIDKLNYLQIELPNYKNLLNEISSVLKGKPIFLILDDFYFTLKDIQPSLIDYFHTLTKDTKLYLKIATIKYRTKLYKMELGQYIGVQLGHDILEVDMDYTLDNFDELQGFMSELLSMAIKGSGSKVSLEDMFAGDGFSQLCLASGGVPRDFLSLFVALGTNKPTEKIGKIDVTDIAIQNIDNKIDSLKKDSGDDNVLLENCLSQIKKFVYNFKKTNAFLVSREDLDNYSSIRQVIRELVDLRLIHLLDDNISKAPSDGKRYEAYILDVGLYDNSRAQNFKQIDPSKRDEKSRRDDIRSSPVIPLRVMDDASEGKCIKKPIAESIDITPDGILIPRQLTLSFE